MNWRDWLPTPQQMSDAAQLRPTPFGATTMRQGLGLIFCLGLLAGLIPAVADWILGLRMGSPVPLARLAQAVDQILSTRDTNTVIVPLLGDLTAWLHLFQILPGMETGLPGWLGATLSALGLWLSRPLRWLSLWIVYGALVMVVNKALGATTTLQRFYAATALAAVPLLLTAFAPLPCLGRILEMAAWLWAGVVYWRANHQVTGFSPLRALAGVIVPAVVIGVGITAFGVILAILLLLSLA